MANTWLFTSNVFRLLADRSLQRFFKFCYIFMEGLQAHTNDPFFNDKYQQLLPYYNTFNDAYDLKFGHKAQHKGDTKKFYQLLKQMSATKAHAWDIAIQMVFLSSTPEYTTIFPQGLTPLSTLSIEQRIKYLLNAVSKVKNFNNLDNVYNDMQTFYAELVAARDAQEQKGASVKNSIDEVLQKAYELSDEIYGVLGETMTKFRKNPAQIETFFPVFLLRYKKKAGNGNTDIYEITIAAGSVAEAGFSFNINDKFNLYNTGETDLTLYFVADQSTPKPNNIIKLPPQEIKTILVKDYATQNDRFMMIENLSPTEEGDLEISLV